MTALIINFFFLTMSSAEATGDVPQNPCQGIDCPDNGTCTVIEGEPVCAIESLEPASEGAQGPKSPPPLECERDYQCPKLSACWKGECIARATKKLLKDAPAKEPEARDETVIHVRIHGTKLFIAGAVLGGILYGVQSSMSCYYKLAGPPMYLAANSYIYMMQAAQAMAMKQLREMGAAPSEKMKKLYKAGWFFLILSSLSAIGPLGVLIDAGVDEDPNWRHDVYLGLTYGVCMPLAIISSSVIFGGRRRLTKEIEKAASGGVANSDARTRVYLSPQVTPVQGGAALGISGVF